MLGEGSDSHIFEYGNPVIKSRTEPENPWKFWLAGLSRSRVLPGLVSRRIGRVTPRKGTVQQVVRPRHLQH